MDRIGLQIGVDTGTNLNYLIANKNERENGSTVIESSESQN